MYKSLIYTCITEVCSRISVVVSSGLFSDKGARLPRTQRYCPPRYYKCISATAKYYQRNTTHTLAHLVTHAFPHLIVQHGQKQQDLHNLAALLVEEAAIVPNEVHAADPVNHGQVGPLLPIPCRSFPQALPHSSQVHGLRYMVIVVWHLLGVHLTKAKQGAGLTQSGSPPLPWGGKSGRYMRENVTSFRSGKLFAILIIGISTDGSEFRRDT